MKKYLLLISIAIAVSSVGQNYKYLGNYSSNGKPLYLVSPGDNVSNESLSLINNALPEGYPVPKYNPQYITSGYDSDISLTANADIWVTFVQEGAGYLNVLGFYTYNTNNPPTTAPGPDNITIIFPNVSAEGSGGGLKRGDKVKIGSFSAGTSIGWVLIANGWNGSKVGYGNWTLYSNRNFNPESNSNLRHHNVQLYDSQSSRIFLGFEDIRRDNSSCDNDFNDAIFYVTANPITAIKTENLTDIKSATDVSSSNAGGLESNGDLASKIAVRNFLRSKLNTTKNLKSSQISFKSTRANFLDVTAGNFANYFPETGMYGTEKAYISSPEDLIGITNAEKVFSVDYYQDEKRISAVLATETKGSVYDHTKVICDRLNSSSLEDIRTVTVNDHQIISTIIKRSTGQIERSISFSVKKGETQNELFSFWNLNEYPKGDYYNFQIWGSSFSQVFSIANYILDKLSSEKPLLSDTQDEKIPSVFVKSGHYSNGEIHLKVVNKSSLKSIEVNGNIMPTENSERINLNQTLNLSGNWNDSIAIYTGSLFDIGFSISAPGLKNHDALYLADGPWGLDYLKQETLINEFSVYNKDSYYKPESHIIERQPFVSGLVKGTVNLFRQVLPGQLSLDVSGYNSLSFTIRNSHPVEVILMTEDLKDWNNRLRIIIPGNNISTDYVIFFSDFVNNDLKSVSPGNINRIVFSLQGDYKNFVPFSVEIDKVAFTKSTKSITYKPQIETRNSTIMNYPNPFINSTTILMPYPISRAEIKVFDITGKLVDIQILESTNVNREIKYNPAGGLNGLYKYILTDDNGNNYNGTFFIKK